MQLPFRLGPAGGIVDVDVVPQPGPVGFPACTARVTTTALGYAAMCGWVQVVRSTDGATGGREFEPDPFALFADADHPYCFYGHAPTLFDAPSRPQPVADLDWIAHAFLATTPIGDDDPGPSVAAIAGFAWGFRVRGGRASLDSPMPLTPDTWRDLVPSLAAHYPRWRFDDARF